MEPKYEIRYVKEVEEPGLGRYIEKCEADDPMAILGVYRWNPLPEEWEWVADFATLQDLIDLGNFIRSL